MMEKETENRIRRIKVGWPYRSIKKRMFEEKNESREVQERKLLVIPDQQRLFFFFSFFQSMVIFSPINVAKVNRHPRRRGRSAQIQTPGKAHHLNLYWLCTLALGEPVMCTCHFPAPLASNLPEGGMKGTRISRKSALQKHLKTNCLRRLAIGNGREDRIFRFTF